MEVDTNELLHRIGAVLRGISDKLDRLIAIGERVEGEVRLPSKEEAQTFSNAKEPAKSLAELICEPVEPILPKVGDWVRVTRPENWEECADPCWSPDMHRFDGRVGQIEAEWAGRFELRGFANSRGIRVHFHRDWLQAGWSCPSPVRPPATEEPEPGWEPKVGDWVKVTRPEDWIEWRHPRWEGSMHKFDGQVGQIEREREGHFQIRGFVASKECSYIFHRDWLSPAEPPKPPQPEYREPVLPADAGKRCEFSISGKTWDTLELVGWNDDPEGWPWKSRLSNNDITCWKRCRIKKDA